MANSNYSFSSQSYRDGIQELKEWKDSKTTLKIVQKDSFHFFQSVLNIYLNLPQLLENLFVIMKSNDNNKRQTGFIIYLAIAFNLRVGERSNVGPLKSYLTNIDNYNLLQLLKDHVSFLKDSSINLSYKNKNFQINRTVRVSSDFYQLFFNYVNECKFETIFSNISSRDINEYLKTDIDDNLVYGKLLKKLRTTIECQKEINLLRAKGNFRLKKK